MAEKGKVNETKKIEKEEKGEVPAKTFKRLETQPETIEKKKLSKGEKEILNRVLLETIEEIGILVHPEIEVSLIKDLIERGADVNTKNRFGTPVLHETIERNQIEIAKLLIEKGADVNASDAFGNTALHQAVISCTDPEIVRLLLEKGADVNAKDKAGYTPLDLATQTIEMKKEDEGMANNLKTIIRLLIEHGGKFEATKEEAEGSKEKEEKKSFLQRTWQKMKKPLAAGVLTAGLLMTPVKGSAIDFRYARDPPWYASQILEKEYPEGWKLVMRAHKNATSGGISWPYEDAAIKYFKKAYEKDKKSESLYMWAWCVYWRASAEPTFEGTEEMEKEALKLIEKRLEEIPNDLHFIDLKLMIYYNLAIMYGRAATGQMTKEDEIDAFKSYKIDFYKEKTKEYANKYSDLWNKTRENWKEMRFVLFEISDEVSEKGKPLYYKRYEKNEQEINEILKKIKNE